MPSLIGKKIGMTRIFDQDRRIVPCTVVEAGPCVVTQIKTEENDGYEAIQIAFGNKREKNTSKPMQGHFAKAGTTPKRVIIESDYFVPFYYKKTVTEGQNGPEVSWEGESGEKLKPGDSYGVNIFRPGEFVDVVGRPKGKGYQGVVRLHGFSGVGGSTHGQHNRGRAPGSMGACSTPSRVFKGMRMAGRMGSTHLAKTQNLQVLKVIPEKNLILISGAVPGHIGSYLFIEK